MNTITGASPGTQYSNFKVDEQTGSITVGLKAGGVDVDSMVDAVKKTTEAKKQIPQRQLDLSDLRRDALAKIQLNTMNLEESIRALQGKNILDSKRGVFGLLSPRYSDVNGTEGSKYISVTADRNAEPRTADIAVIKVAEQDSVKASAKFADITVAAALEGTLTFKNYTPVAEGDPPAENVVITLTGTESAQQIVGIVNAFQAKTGVHASLIPSGNDYVMAFNAIEFSRPVAYDADLIAGNTDLLPESRTSSIGLTDITNPSVALNIEGTLSFPHIDGISPDIEITILATDSATDIQTKINTQAGDTNVGALIIGDPGAQRLLFEREDNQSTIAFTKTITSGDGGFIPEPKPVTAESLKAIVEFEGEQSSHASNKVTLPDMTVDLLQATPGAPDAAEPVKVHLEKLKLNIGDAATQFVEMSKIIFREIDILTAVDPETFDLTEQEKEEYGERVGVLRNDTTVQNLKTYLTTMFTRSVDGISMGNVGIKIENGSPIINLKDFNDAFDRDPKAVEKLFTYSEISTDPLLSTSTHPNTIPTTLNGVDLTISIEKDGSGIYTASITYPGNVGSPISFIVTEQNGSYLTLEPEANPETGEVSADNIFKGFSFYYDKDLANGESVTSTLRVHQGLADQALGYLSGALGPNGSFETQMKSYEKERDAITEKIEKIDERGKKDEERMRVKMLAAMQRAQALQNMLKQIQFMEMSAYAAAAA